MLNSILHGWVHMLSLRVYFNIFALIRSFKEVHICGAKAEMNTNLCSLEQNRLIVDKKVFEK